MKNLGADALQSLKFLRDLRLLGGGGVSQRAFIAISGLYENAQMEQGMKPNPGISDFKDDAACVKTSISDLQGIVKSAQNKGTVDIGPLPVGNHDQAYALVEAAANTLRSAIQNDFPAEYARAQVQEGQRTAGGR